MADDIADVLAEIARSLVAEDDYDATLCKVTQLAVATIEGCDHAGITLVHGRRLETVAPTGDVPVEVDRIQYEVDEGPCLSSIRDYEMLKSDDLGNEERWPMFANRTAETTGVLSMLSFRLFVESDTMGALNLYSKQVAAFSQGDSEHIGALFAAHAAVAMTTARETQNLKAALVTRNVIGQAQGILMATQNLTSAEAIETLKKTSQRLNVKLRSVASAVTFTGEIPQTPDGC